MRELRFIVVSVALVLSACASSTRQTPRNAMSPPDPGQQNEIPPDAIRMEFIAPTHAEMSNLFDMIDYLTAIESETIPFDSNVLDRTADAFLVDRTIRSLFFLSAIYQTDYAPLRDWYKGYVRDNDPVPKFTKVAQQLWKYKKPVASAQTLVTSVSPSGKRDEGLNTFHLHGMEAFNGRLVFYVFRNPWTVISIGDGNSDEDSVALVAGGPTNAMKVQARKHATPTVADYSLVVSRSEAFLKEKYGHVESMDLSAIGTYSRTNAERVMVQFAAGKDLVPSIVACQAAVFLYSATENATYSVSFFMNISERNQAYDILDLRFNQIVYLTALVYLEQLGSVGSSPLLCPRSHVPVRFDGLKRET